jgi:hypothetical protein
MHVIRIEHFWYNFNVKDIIHFYRQQNVIVHVPFKIKREIKIRNCPSKFTCSILIIGHSDYEFSTYE